VDKESINRLMKYVDDPELKDTMQRVSDNLDRVDRMKDMRLNPEEEKIRRKNVRDLLDADMENKVRLAAEGVALVLTGGGGKGSYQAGALQAILESETLKITGIAGTSVGALNAALFAAGDADSLKKLWCDLKEDKMNGQDGFFGPSEENDRYLEDLIRDSGVTEKITPESLLTVVTAFDYENGYPRDFILNKMSEEDKVRCLLASSAFPVAFKEREISGVKYIDGGIPVFGSNMPAAPLYHLGFRRFIVIHCSSRREASEWTDLSKLNLMVNQEQYYNGAVFVHLYPGTDLGGVIDGTANFNHKYIMNNMQKGFEDMIKAREDLSVLSEKPGALDELHVLDGERYRSFKDLLEHL